MTSSNDLSTLMEPEFLPYIAHVPSCDTNRRRLVLQYKIRTQN